MANFAGLGKGVGLLYVTDVDGTSILSNINNDQFAVRKAKLLAIEAGALSVNLIASGKVAFTGLGAGDVTAININGVNQMSGPETWAGDNDVFLDNVVENINAFTPTSGADYIAIVLPDETIQLFATSEAGSTVNGDVVVMATDTPAEISSTDTNVSGGSDSNEIYDTAYGFRFFLNDSDTAEEGDLIGALEITDLIIQQGLQTSVKTQSVEIIDDTATIERKGQETWVDMGVQSGNTDDLQTINVESFSEGDKIFIRGTDSGNIITINQSDNISLIGGTTFATAGYETLIGLQLWEKGGGEENLWYWFEIYRSPQSVASVSAFRTSNLPMISTYGEATIALGTSGTTTLKANTAKQKQILTGTQELDGDLEIALSVVDAIAGDIFFIENNAKITLGAFTYIIAGISLTATQAFNGGHLILAYYNGTAWNTWLLLNMNNSATRGNLENDDIATGTIDIQKIEAAHQKTTTTLSLSFETGYVGAHKSPVQYPGTVTKVIAYVTKAIESTDDASIIVKDGSGNAMGTIVVARGAGIGNAFTLSPSANNTFVAGDVLTFETAKSTKGGGVNISIEQTRT